MVTGNTRSIDEKRHARTLIGKTVVTKSGKKFGVIGNISFEARTGELMQIILNNPTSYIDHLDIEQDKEGNWMVPFSSVIAVGDFVVVAEEDIV
jgi:sporulation protein YlmC with PRC-barrel domain